MSRPESGAPNGTPLLETTDLTKHFSVRRGTLGFGTGLVRAVDSISFTIDAATTLGLVGESGCGKTTTSRAIPGLERPTAGSIRFEGKDVAALGRDERRHYRRSVQAVFQDPYASLDPRMRVSAIVAEPLVINSDLDATARRRRVAELLDRVGLPYRAAALAPQHPYTKALFAAALPIDLDTPREEVVLTGEVPSPLDPPSGCRFHPRCPFAMPHCAREEPALRTQMGRLVACHLY